MQKEDLKQIADLMDEKLSGFKDEIVNEIGGIVNTAFSEFEGRVNAKFEGIENELALKPSLSHFNDWADRIMTPVQLDVDRLKYINREEMKTLPTQLEISETLIQEGIN